MKCLHLTVAHLRCTAGALFAPLAPFHGHGADVLYWLIISCLAARNHGRVKSLIRNRMPQWNGTWPVTAAPSPTLMGSAAVAAATALPTYPPTTQPDACLDNDKCCVAHKCCFPFLFSGHCHLPGGWAFTSHCAFQNMSRAFMHRGCNAIYCRR